MKFTKTVRRWTIAAVVAFVGMYLIGDTTILFNYTILNGTTMSPSAAHGWCTVATNELTYAPPGCGQENGPLTAAALCLIAGIAFVLVAVFKAYNAAHHAPTEQSAPVAQ